MNLVTALRGYVIALLMLAGAVPALADERIGVIAAELEPAPAGAGGAVLNATFEFEMPQALDEAVQKGIAIYFNIEFELYRKRWYWLDRKVSSSTLTYRLSFSPLTRQFRLARGGLSQPFESLEEALGLLKSVRQWKVIEKGMLSPGDSYEAQVRMRLDVTQLPKPFQVNAITSREWSLASDWRELAVPPELAR
ncbi:MAG TPA: DUF4390 domain-containing protein [Burkholderiaceae bacterium]|nr:DUF4390 domain-containing protein [Burkholderiaceae bacterium]HQR75435.1 DUF4390 domain-containing protein [Burkholderiaceae bacterium]